MSDQRWAARYTFCDTLWRGHARVVADPELEALLSDADPQRAAPDDAALELLDALLPRERGVPVWMVVGSDETARALAPSRPGVRFVAAVTAAEVFAREPWEVALVGLRDPRGGESADWLPAIADAVAHGRTAVVGVADDDATYDALVELAGAYFSDARIYAMYRPSMFAFVELDDGELLDGNGKGGDELELSAIPTQNRYDRWDVGDEGELGDDDEHDDDAVPLVFDNTLGSAEPQFLGYLAIAGAPDPPDGLTLVEVAAADGDVDPAMRHQLAQARRQADLVAIERQRLVERIDALESDNAALREALSQLRDQLAGSLDPGATGERLDATLAREQSLRWRVSALERELDALRVRPVDELEAELAAARAQLAAAAAEARDGGTAGDDPAAEGPSNGHPGGQARRVGTDDARRLPAVRAGASGRTAALRAVEGLVRRIDRGAIGTNDLRRELSALRRRLRG